MKLSEVIQETEILSPLKIKAEEISYWYITREEKALGRSYSSLPVPERSLQES